MSAEVEVDRGAYTDKPAWHDIKGVKVVNERLPMADFLERAKMGYDVTKEQHTRVNAAGVTVNVPNQFDLVRSDDEMVVSPSTVTARYFVRTPTDLATVLDPIVQNGLGIWDTGFTLYGGQSEVVTVRLCDIKSKPGCDSSDWIYFLIAQNFHGNGKVRFVVAGNRVVCSNTVAQAFAGGADLAMVHSKSIVQKFADAPKVWEKAAKAIQAHCEKLAKLDKIVNVPETIDELLAIDDDSTTQQKNRRDRIVAAAHMPKMGTNGRTLYDIFNAITFDNTHNTGGKSGGSMGTRMESILDGTRGDFEAAMTSKLFALAGV